MAELITRKEMDEGNTQADLDDDCEHDWDYVDAKQKPYEDDGFYWLDVECSNCGKKGKEKYTFEGTEEN